MPRLSDSRPTRMLLPDSSAAVHRKTAPIAAPLYPRCDSRSGTSTDRFPNSRPGSSTSQKHMRSCRSRKAANSAESGCGSSGGAAGVDAANATSPSDATPTAPNVQPVPANDATPPSTGPKSVPADRCRERRADQGPAALDRGRGDQPGEAARPREGARGSLHEPRGEQLPRMVGEAEDDDTEGNGAQADDDGGLHACPGCDRSAGDRPDQHSERIRRCQRARARLAKPQGGGCSAAAAG